ncbi:RraA family protein [Chakrabartyella piscis]|uniref:RraA family protein n=1 Tax=Chakrabartyella piscis TaxID=2918914 RepID=UPI0029585ACD|nr:RraA family protein [Chakrabartyella piscis]
MLFASKEEIITMTSLWKGERFADGRPKVPDKYLDALQDMTLEELWKPIFVLGYESQFEGRMHTLHSEFNGDGSVNVKMVGRALTAAYVPSRPDLFQVGKEEAAAKGYAGTPNQWMVDSLQERDVAVVDMYDKIYKGTFLGGNLATALKAKTQSGGAVIWGGVRDVEQMKQIPDIQVYYRGIDPTPIRDFALSGFNCPVKIGKAICMPGDVVFGHAGGVLFIPPHLVPEVVDGAKKTQVKDMFGFEMIQQNKFTTAQIDKNVWTIEMMDLLLEFIQNEECAKEYRTIDWTKEYQEAHDGIDTGSAM